MTSILNDRAVKFEYIHSEKIKVGPAVQFC